MIDSDDMVNIVDQLLSTIRARHPHASQRQVATMLTGCLHHYNRTVLRNGQGNGRSDSSPRISVEESPREESIPEGLSLKKPAQEKKPGTGSSEAVDLESTSPQNARLKSEQPDSSNGATSPNETTPAQPSPDEDTSSNSALSLYSSHSGLTTERNTPETETFEESDRENSEDDDEPPKDPQTSNDTLCDSDKENEHAGPNTDLGNSESESESEDGVGVGVGAGIGSRSALRGRGGWGGGNELMTPPESP
jgi:hypothetical protein